MLYALQKVMLNKNESFGDHCILLNWLIIMHVGKSSH